MNVLNLVQQKERTGRQEVPAADTELVFSVLSMFTTETSTSTKSCVLF